MHPIRSTKRSLFFLAAGAAAAYLFDPESGRPRREQLLAKLQQYVPSSKESDQTSVDVEPPDTAGASGHDTTNRPASRSYDDLVVSDLASDHPRDDGEAAAEDVGAPAYIGEAR